MFDDWKEAWRQAVENFQREVSDGIDGAPPRVKAMEREVTSANGALLRLGEEIRRTRRELDAESEAQAVCRRREGLARDAGDEDTTAVAARFAARHAERAAVLKRKLDVLTDEYGLLERDLASMRDIIASTPGVSAGSDRAEGSSSAAGSAATTSRPPSGRDSDARSREDVAFSKLEDEARDRAASERLEELKRRMGG